MTMDDMQIIEARFKERVEDFHFNFLNDPTALKIAKIGQIAMNEFTDLLAKDDNILATSGETRVNRESDKPNTFDITIFKKED